jgi:two-component system sensor histidine kinase KdpD
LSREGRRDLLQVIDEESDRLNRFIEGLSVVDRPDRLLGVTSRSVAVDEVVEAAVARARSLTRDHVVRVDIPSAATPVAVDAAAITEVIYILLDNASQYAPASTEIRVTASRHDALHVAIEVADEGPGIPPALRERIFDKFFRIPGREPHDPNRAGIGLGLPIARRLVEAQAGRIWVQGAPGQGTAVIMTLPAADPLQAASAAPS